MRAIQYHRYGGPEVLQLTDIPRPTPGPDEVLVRIVATSINAADYRLMRADPFLVRLENGLFRPKKHTVLGSDFSGTVEAVGDRVTSVVVGDEVFGETFPKGLGAFAEYATAPATSVVKKPKSVSFETAAAATMGGITALQGLALASVRAQTRLLVQGACGASLFTKSKAYISILPHSVRLLKSGSNNSATRQKWTSYASSVETSKQRLRSRPTFMNGSQEHSRDTRSMSQTSASGSAI